MLLHEQNFVKSYIIRLIQCLTLFRRFSLPVHVHDMDYDFKLIWHESQGNFNDCEKCRASTSN